MVSWKRRYLILNSRVRLGGSQLLLLRYPSLYPCGDSKRKQADVKVECHVFSSFKFANLYLMSEQCDPRMMH